MSFSCLGHCYGVIICPYAKLIRKDGQIIGLECKLPKKISESFWKNVPVFQFISNSDYKCLHPNPFLKLQNS